MEQYLSKSRDKSEAKLQLKSTFPNCSLISQKLTQFMCVGHTICIKDKPQSKAPSIGNRITYVTIYTYIYTFLYIYIYIEGEMILFPHASGD